MNNKPDVRTEAGKKLLAAAWEAVEGHWITEDWVEHITAIEAEAKTQERERIANDLIFDLPIGDDVNYSRGYSAAIREMRRVLREEPA